MMDYYYLKLSSRIKRPIRIKGFDILASTAPFETYPELSVYYFDYIKGETEVTSILTSPVFLAVKEIRDLFALYSTKMQFKGMQLFSSEDEEEIQAPLYFLADIPRVDCLSSKVRINPNGTINTVILDKNKLNLDPIFMPEHLAEQKVIVNEDVAESLLRRNLYGIDLEKVEVID